MLIAVMERRRSTIIRLIDANKLVDMLYDNEFASLCPLDEVSGVIDACPTVDADFVVRCKDCKYADGKKETNVEKRYVADILVCRNSDLCGDEPLAMWPDDFCSYGERKNDDNAT